MKPWLVGKFSLLRVFSYALLVIILFFSSYLSASANSNSRIKDWKYKGIAITAYWSQAFQSPYLKRQIDYYANLGVNAIEFTPVWHQNSPTDNKIHPDQLKTIPTEDLVAAINYAKREKGLRVNLKPHLELYPRSLPRLAVEEFIDFYNKASPDNQQLLWRCYTLSDSQKYYEPAPTIEEQSKETCKTLMEHIDPGFFWRARIKPRQVDCWFSSYRAFLEYYLDIAIKNEVDLFTVGTELVSMTRPEYVKRWEELMLALRAYADKNSSKIQFTYAAAAHEVFGAPAWEEREYYQKRYSQNYLPRIFGERWNGNFEPFARQTILDASPQNSTVDLCKRFQPKNPAASQHPTADLNHIKQALRRFWSLFDVISITVYFELGDYLSFKVDDDPSKLSETERDGGSRMLERWRCKISELENWRTQLDLNEKPVLFAELGYRSVNYGHYKPYQSQDKIFSFDEQEVFNGENQANAYKTAFQALANISKFEGVFLWQEEIKDPPGYTNNINTSYSLIGKPAAAIIRSAFAGADSERQRLPMDKNPNGMSIKSRQTEESRLLAVPSCLSIDLHDRDDYIDRYDLDAGGGLAESSQNKKSWYAWSKFRVRPISYCLSLDATDKIHVDKIQFGLWFSGATGGGEVPVFDSEYNWNRFLGGLTAKASGKGMSWDIDLGIGNVRENSSAQRGEYKSKQTDHVYYLFSHFEWRRRDFGDKWFPKISLDVEGLGVFDSNQSRRWEGQALKSDPYDRRRFEFVLAPGLMDMLIWKNKLRLTPEAIIGYGREYGESDFHKAGLGVTLGFNKPGDNKDLITLGVAHRSAREGQQEGFIWVDLLKFFNE